MEFRVFTSAMSPLDYVGESSYSIDGTGVLTVRGQEGRKTVFAPHAWDRVEEKVSS